MIRYILFAGQSYYAKGGANDYAERYDTLDESIAKGEELIAKSQWSEDWYHVFDVETGKIVAKTEYQAYGNN